MQAPFYAGLGDYFVGGEWRADTNHNTLMAVTNVGAKATDALLTLHYDNGERKYELQQRIEPGEQMWLNFADLIHRRVADRKGRLLPADLTSGTYDVRDLDPGKGGNLIVGGLALDTTLGRRPQPGIAHCCPVGGPEFVPSQIDVLPDGLQDLGIWGVDECNGNQEDISAYFGQWWSQDTSIATLAYEQAKGVSPGFTNGEAEGCLPLADCSCQIFYPEVPAKVYVPTATAITGQIYSYAINSNNAPLLCTGTQQGWYREVQKIVTDQWGDGIILEGQSLYENVTVGKPNQLGIGTVNQGEAVTNANGNFTDTFYVCSSACPGSGQTDASQAIEDDLPDGWGDYNLSPNALVYECSSITVNGQ